jgi:hypothetical protein
MRCMGCALYIRCALSIHQKECRKSLGCALYIGVRYLLENTVIIFFIIGGAIVISKVVLVLKYVTYFSCHLS